MMRNGIIKVERKINEFNKLILHIYLLYIDIYILHNIKIL